jgi:single-strand DNA-binding protein
MNQVSLIGRLTKEPEIKYTSNGKANTRFTLAVQRTYTNLNGEKEADFINCSAWGKIAENIANYLKKGYLVGLTGRIQTSILNGEDGKKVFYTEVVAESVNFLESKK